jgi:phosphopantothenate-cysteine ligase
VSDYGVENYVDTKIRSKESEMSIQLKVLPKLISNIRKWAPDIALVGFKLLVDSTEDELVDAARKSIKSNRCDFVVANDLRDIKSDERCVYLVYSKSVKFIKDDGEGKMEKEIIKAVELSSYIRKHT